MTKINLNTSQINRMMGRAGELFQSRLEEESQKMLTEQRRSYPRATTRSDGSVVTSPRDVVDTGELRDSFKTNLQQSGNSLLITQEWLADHAALVYMGWTSSTGLDIPPWQWMKELEEYVSLEDIFAESCDRARREVFGG